MTETSPAGLRLQEAIAAERDGHDLVVRLTPATKIVKDLTRVPKELRPTLSVAGDVRWDLTPLVHKKTLAGRLSINFDTFPAPYRATAKRLIWSYINVATPVADLDRATATRSQISPTSVCASAGLLRGWMNWLAERNVLQFSEVTDRDFDDYCDELCGAGIDRSVVAYKLFATTRAWLYAPYLPPEDRLKRPTWESGTGGRSDVLGPANWSSENKTTPIHPQTMSALLVWAVRFVENFSTDIIAAKSMKSVPRQCDSESAPLSRYEQFRQYLDRRRESSQTAPGMAMARRPDLRCFARKFIAWELGIAEHELGGITMNDSLTRGLEPSEEAHLPLTITGTIDGETKWIEAVNFYEVEELCRHLATATFIVIAYLTGMRSEECRALEHGCCQPTTNTPTGHVNYAIHGKTFKAALDEAGNAIPDGANREHPWLAIAPVAKAVAVMEALHPESTLLFPIEAFTAAPELSLKGSAVHPRMVRDRVAALIDWCNQTALRLGRSEEMIPPDPDGRVTVQRFRRTLAWFIYRKPGGRIALGVQYGHLRGHTTDGYGSRVATGLRDVFPMEEALARAEYLEEAHFHMEDGEHVSGPASGRYAEALRLYGQEFRGRYLSSKQAAALRANPRLRIYDNAAQFVTCCYDQSKALCHPDRRGPSGSDETPDINHCQPNCGNIARTDRNIDQLADAIARNENEIASPTTPEPLRARLAQRVTALKLIVLKHDEGHSGQ